MKSFDERTDPVVAPGRLGVGRRNGLHWLDRMLFS
jgi:hypothetical protein